MQSQLLDQRLTQVGVIVHDQQSPRLGHEIHFTYCIAGRLAQDYGEPAADFSAIDLTGFFGLVPNLIPKVGNRCFRFGLVRRGGGVESAQDRRSHLAMTSRRKILEIRARHSRVVGVLAIISRRASSPVMKNDFSLTSPSSP
jgi:hypothetical protein